MNDYAKAIVSMPGEERIVHPAGGPIVIQATSGETEGRMGMFEGLIAPGGAVDWHCHTREDEVFRVVSGRFRISCGHESFDGGPGLTVVAPRGVPHRWANLTDSEARLLCIVTPGGFEGFFKDLDAGNPAGADFAAVCERYGLLWGATP